MGNSARVHTWPCTAVVVVDAKALKLANVWTFNIKLVVVISTKVVLFVIQAVWACVVVLRRV